MNTAFTLSLRLMSSAASDILFLCSVSDSLIVSGSVPSAIFLFRSPRDSIDRILANFLFSWKTEKRRGLSENGFIVNGSRDWG